jgi:hypothetical protein
LAESTAIYRLSVRLSKVSGLQKPATSARICRKSAAQTAEIPVFLETIGRDWFDHH